MTMFTHFVQNYDGPKVAILATGGGVNLARIATVPGASRVLHSFYCPYETQETLRFLQSHLPNPTAFQASAVSPGAALELYEAVATKYPDQRVVVVTAACTSFRWRRGENRAYIACKNAEGVLEVWYLKIPKATKAEYVRLSPDDILQVRDLEDQGISNTVLALMANFTSILEGLKSDGILVLCNP